ncbi:2-hydroxyacid dehydrogenase [Alteromonas lipolytica]|uniref:Hydroxyacid dehydrogenase n=1 Tax=Alteromonas lipolytica TaxID=1856405 RepID=A0A1E8FGR0_9ALTE|nr:2-hydroxyacid dehydrogenase [Alteromonas lipolytica]OFI35099.1 hydroxyacid dehydrogenase [Alteromonas lipolytica]GGF56641.1 2-hydroxyacid dehydrogenase [Alteromonas lipolytica]
MTLPRVAMFSAQQYDIESFRQHPLCQQIELTTFATQLDHKTVSLCQQADVVCAFVNDELDRAILQHLKIQGVTHVALRCAGFNNVDTDAANDLGLAVSRVPAYSPEAVAEHALALIMTLNRKTHKAYNRVREGNFNLNGLLGFTLHGKKVGVVGTGHIGAALVRLLSGFGCEIYCYDPYTDEKLTETGATYTSLNTLLSECHIISLHCPLNEQSYHLINEQSLAIMRDGVMLINTSRGGLIDTHAVIKGLKTHKIGYLGLDVYEMESELFFHDHSSEIIQDDVFERLQTFHNVLITGHQGFFTAEALTQIAGVTLDNIVSWHTGKVSKERFVVKP